MKEGRWTEEERLSFINYLQLELQRRKLEPLLELKGPENCGWVRLELGEYLALISRKEALEATVYDKVKLEDPLVDLLTEALQESGVTKIFYYSALRRELSSK